MSMNRIRNAFVYTLRRPATVEAAAIEKAVSKEGRMLFSPCAPSQQWSFGFAPVDGDDLVVTLPSALAFGVKIQERKLPAKAVEEAVAERVSDIEQRMGRKVGRKERLTLKDDVIAQLLPRTPPQSRLVIAYLDLQAHWLVVDATNATTAEVVASTIRQAIDGFPVIPAEGRIILSSVLTQWLAGSRSDAFSMRGQAVLYDPVEPTHKARLQGHDLYASDAVNSLLSEGMVAGSMRLRWRDEIDFTAAQPWHLKRISMPEEMFEEAEGNDESTRFTGDMHLQISALRDLLADYGKTMGGWQRQLNFEEAA